MTTIFEEVKNTPEMKKIYEKMSEEEKTLTDIAISKLLAEFEKNVLEKFGNLKKAK